MRLVGNIGNKVGGSNKSGKGYAHPWNIGIYFAGRCAKFIDTRTARTSLLAVLCTCLTDSANYGTASLLPP